jgi:hypothetical protein
MKKKEREPRVLTIYVQSSGALIKLNARKWTKTLIIKALKDIGEPTYNRRGTIDKDICYVSPRRISPKEKGGPFILEIINL